MCKLHIIIKNREMKFYDKFLILKMNQLSPFFSLFYENIHYKNE